MDDPWSAETDTRLKALGERVQDAMEQYHVPGVAMGLLYEGRTYTAGFGVTNVRHPLPVDADTLFQIGSITKAFTATLAMQLVERGQLALDAPVRTYLPGLRLRDEAAAASVTMRHLLTHTAGWEGDFFEDTGDGDDALARMVERMADLPQVVPVGTAFSYNNAGFYLAGRVIEVLTNAPFETAMKEQLLEPLGLQRSFFFAKEVITDRVAVGHQVREGTPHVLREWALQRATSPAGGLICTVQDVLRYARFHLGDGTTVEGVRVLAPGSLVALQAPQVPLVGGNWCALDWAVREVSGARIVSHDGGTNGQVSLLVLVPSRQFAMVVVTNADTGGPLTRSTVTQAQETLLDLRAPAPTPEPVSADLATLLVGRYTARGRDIDVRLEDGVLLLTVIPTRGFPRPDSPLRPPLPPAPVMQLGPDVLLVVAGELQDGHIAVVRRRDGSILGLHASRLHVRLEERG